MTAYLAPSLVKLRSGFKLIAPNSDTSSDGWIGDYNHCHGCTVCCSNYSDHCADCKGMVHAIDKDKDLNSPYGVSMMNCINKILATPYDLGRLKYIIFNRTIWSATYNWTARPYDGVNPHTEHAHFSLRYTSTAENDTTPWSIEQFAEDDMTPQEHDMLNHIFFTLTTSESWGGAEHVRWLMLKSYLDEHFGALTAAPTTVQLTDEQLAFIASSILTEDRLFPLLEKYFNRLGTNQPSA